MEAKNRIIVALDVDSLDKAKPLVESLAPYVGCFKVGLELLTAVGAPRVVDFVQSLGGKVFYDGKFDDIPNTVGAAAKAIAGVKMFNVHASAGVEAMMAAVANKGQSLVLAVTVLTSLEENNAHLIFGGPSKAKVLQLARDAKLAGCDGVICSPQELELLGKQKELNTLLKVTPGVRPEWAAAGDQKRIMTPAEAIKAGATALVIGRPITKPPTEIGTPIDAVKRIIAEIDGALRENLIDALYDRGAIKFGAFKLKLHEKNPDAPLSPIYLNLRRPPDGPLTDDDVEAIGQEIFAKINGPAMKFDLVAGIPRAGEPFANVVSRLSRKPILKLGKKVEGDKRKIDSVIEGAYLPGQNVLIIDDLITQADTKKEAIGVCEEAKLVVAGIAVLADREQGGTGELETEGYGVYSVFKLYQLLDYYVRVGKITQAKRDEVMAYIAANK